MSWRVPRGGGRPRATLGLAVPSPQWRPGIVSLDAMWARQLYEAASALFVDAGVGLSVRTQGSDGAIRIDVAHALRGGGGTWRR